MGKYPRSTKGNHYLIVASDICSKWVEAKPIRVATSKHIIQFLEEDVFSRFGFPKIILSDNGSQFLSQEFKDACLRWGSTHHTSATYSPRMNQVERRNQSIKEKLRLQLLDQPHCNWDKEIPQILFSLRNSINQATKVAPAQVYFNQRLRHPKETDNTISEQSNSDTISLFPYHQKAISNQKRYVQKYEGKEPFTKLHPVGAIVLIRNHELSSAPRGFCAAFSPKWCGPFEVVHVYPAGIYICRLIEDPTIHRKVSHQDTQLRHIPTLTSTNNSYHSYHPTSSSSTGIPRQIEIPPIPSTSSDGTPRPTHHPSPIPSPSTTPSTSVGRLVNGVIESSITTSGSNVSHRPDIRNRPIRTRIFNSKYYGKDWTT